MAGDVAPESIAFVPASESPVGKDLLVLANENSGTVALYAIEDEEKAYAMHETYTELVQDNAGGVLIYEVYGSGGKDEAVVNRDFITLVNPTKEPVYMENWKLRYSSMRDASERVWQELTLNAMIPAGGQYTVACAETNYTADSLYFTLEPGEYDAVWNDVTVDNKQFSIELADASGNKVDALGVADDGTETGEGELLAEGINKHSVVLRNGMADTDNNNLDFIVVDLDDVDAAGRADYKPVSGHASAVKYTVSVDTPWGDWSYDVAEGGTVSFSVTAASGWTVTGVSADGEALTAESGKYTLTVTADTSVVVTATAPAEPEPEPEPEPDEDEGGCSGALEGGVTGIVVAVAAVLAAALVITLVYRKN